MDNASVIHERPVVQFTERPEPRKSSTAKVKKKKKAKRVKTQNQQGEGNEGQEGEEGPPLPPPDWPPIGKADVVQQQNDEKTMRRDVQALGELVETVNVDGIFRKVLFLQNQQADLLAKEDDIDQKILSAFQVKYSPKMIINLCMSKGFRDYVSQVNCFHPSISAGMVGTASQPVPGGTPFLKPIDSKNSPETEDDVEERLDLFMKLVVLPIAEETNALILCSAICGMCALTKSLTRVVAASEQRWADGKPFTIIYTTPLMFHLYFSSKTEQWWQRLKSEVGHWKETDTKLEAAKAKKLEAEKENPQKHAVPKILLADLEKLGENFILVDSLHGNEFDHHVPFNTLMTKLLGQFWRRLPVFAIKTGGGARQSAVDGAAADPSSLQAAQNFLAAGMPVVWVDVRRRTKPKPPSGSWNVESEKLTRQYVRDLALKEWRLLCKELRDQSGGRLVETFDACTMAYFRKVLQQTRADESETSAFAMRIVDEIPRIWEDARLLHKGEMLEKQDADLKDFFEHRRAMRVTVRDILSSRQSHSINIHDHMTAVKSAIFGLATLNRLPEYNSQEGVRLLIEAEHYYDMAMRWARRYKFVCHLLLLLRLFLGWCIVFVTTGLMRSSEYDPADRELFQVLIFVLTSTISSAVALESFLDPRMLWQQFRSGACRLQKMMWNYRTRTESFVVHRHPGFGSPETAFREELDEWVKTLVETIESVPASFFQTSPSHPLKSQEEERSQNNNQDYADEVPISQSEFEDTLDAIWGAPRQPKKKAADQRSRLSNLAGILKIFNRLKRTKRRQGSHEMPASRGDTVQPRPEKLESGTDCSPPDISRRSAAINQTQSISSIAKVSMIPRTRHPRCDEESEEREELKSKRAPKTRHFTCWASKTSTISTRPNEAQDEKNCNQTPVPADEYLECRLNKMLNYYQQKLPWYNYLHLITRVLLLVLSLSCTLLAYLQLEQSVVVTVSLAGYITTWSTFKDHKGKARYTQTVKNLLELLRWWHELKEIEQASLEQSSKMMRNAEYIILAENASWMSTMTSLVGTDIHNGQDLLVKQEEAERSRGRNPKLYNSLD